jgi:hypothetical protein
MDEDDTVNRTLQVLGMRELLADIDRELDASSVRCDRAREAYMLADDEHDDRAFDAAEAAFQAHAELCKRHAQMRRYIASAEANIAAMEDAS